MRTLTKQLPIAHDCAIVSLDRYSDFERRSARRAARATNSRSGSTTVVCVLRHETKASATPRVAPATRRARQLGELRVGVFGDIDAEASDGRLACMEPSAQVAVERVAHGVRPVHDNVPTCGARRTGRPRPTFVVTQSRDEAGGFLVRPFLPGPRDPNFSHRLSIGESERICALDDGSTHLAVPLPARGSSAAPITPITVSGGLSDESKT